VIVVSLVSSLLVSLSLVPMLASRFLVSPRERAAGPPARTHRLAVASEAALTRLGNSYRNLLHSVLEHRLLTTLAAAAKIAIFESSLAIAQQQREETELRIEVGLVPRNEVAAARAEVALNEQALIDARSVKEAERLRLLRLINPDPAGLLDAQVRATSQSRIEPKSVTDLSDRLRLAERSRPDLNEARMRMEQNRLETVVTRNGLLPRLDLFIMLGKTGFADSFSDAFREIDSDTYDLQAGVRFSHLLGNRGAEARDLAARASTRQAAEAVANLQEIVRFDVRLAVNEVERTRQQISATAVTRARTFRTSTALATKFRAICGLEDRGYAFGSVIVSMSWL
jgi:outer membrane protein TolC